MIPDSEFNKTFSDWAIWHKPQTTSGMKYFVCDRVRNMITKDYVLEFLKTQQHVKMHSTYEEAYAEMRSGFYDDSDYDVFSISDSGTIIRYSSKNCGKIL